MEWVNWLKEITYKYPIYFGLTPLWLFAIAGVSLAIFLKWLSLKSKPAHDSRKRIFGRDLPWIAMVLLAGVMIVALAGPQQSGFKVAQSGGGLDIIIAVDRSASQAIGDISPSRQEVMLREIGNFVRSSAVKTEDRLTLFTFSEKANWKMPLSEDRGEFFDKLEEIEQPADKLYYDRSQLFTFFEPLLKLIPEDLDKQDRFFKNGPFSKKISWTAYPRIIFLFSDGDGDDRSLVGPLGYIAKRGIPIYTVGIGTAHGGSLKIKAPTEADPKKLETLIIQSKLNMKTLNFIKDKTGGKSYVIDSSSGQVQSFLSSAVASNRKPVLALVKSDNSRNFWWEVLAPLSFIFLLAIITKV